MPTQAQAPLDRPKNAQWQTHCNHLWIDGCFFFGAETALQIHRSASCVSDFDGLRWVLLGHTERSTGAPAHCEVARATSECCGGGNAHDEEQDIRLSHYCEIGQPQISVTSDFDQNPGRTAEGDGVDRNAFANRNVQFCTIR